MALTKEDLNAISQLMDEKLKPVNNRLDKMDGRFDKMDGRLDKVEDRLDKMDSRFDKMDSRLDKMDGRLGKVENRLDKMDNRLDIIELKRDRTAKKLEDLRLDIAISERDIRRDIHELKDATETIIEILKMNELLPQ